MGGGGGGVITLPAVVPYATTKSPTKTTVKELISTRIFDNSKRKVLKLQFRSFFVVVENSRAVKLLVKNDWLNFSIH